MLTKYNLKMPHEIFSGEDALENLKTILKNNNVKKVAVFTDKGIQGAGLLDYPMAKIQGGVALAVPAAHPMEGRAAGGTVQTAYQLEGWPLCFGCLFCRFFLNAALDAVKSPTV